VRERERERERVRERERERERVSFLADGEESQVAAEDGADLEVVISHDGHVIGLAGSV
jgi:hypothetical protein